ncbi:uncharacterized protein BDZ99DRAFT_379687, partial [Mytilinidion resinicola]
TGLPLDDLPLAFQQAIMICASLGFEYMWIDSLCILQDSYKDWQVQSAVMGDVYKYACLNVAVLCIEVLTSGYIVKRDQGLQAATVTKQQVNLVQLRSEPWTNESNAPLLKRAWVFQECCLARRTLAFANNIVYWAWILHSVQETAATLAVGAAGSGVALEQTKIPKEQLEELIKAFDIGWQSYVTDYTLYKLTKHTDKLIAFSAVAREMANTQIMGKRRYLAGLWDVNLPFQMAWITVEGQTTPPRKRVGDAGYVAPSWSWASVEAPVQPAFIFNFGNGLVALADVRAAEVALESDYAFGSCPVCAKCKLPLSTTTTSRLFCWRSSKGADGHHLSCEM